MIALKGGGVSVELPQFWAEVKYCQWDKIVECGDDEKKIVELFTGFGSNAVRAFDKRSLRLIRNVLAFINEPFDVKNWSVPPAVNLGSITFDPRIDIKEKEFGQKVIFEDLVKDGEKVNHNLITICELYIQTLITKKHYDALLTEHYKELIYKNILLCDAFAIADNYIKQLEDILIIEANTLKMPPKREQLTAGIEEYNEYGVVNTIRALAGGDITKVNEVLKMDYNMVYLWLRMGKTDTIYADNYAEVMRRKNK